MNGITILQGDVREVIKTLPDESVHCVVTSPPYWGLRDYGTEGQIGLELSPWEYLETMTAVFREVRRVLRTDGTLWLNMGDCYATGAGQVGECPGGGEQGMRWRGYRGTRQCGKHEYIADKMGPLVQPNRLPLPGLKPKDLVGMPWRLAFALQADGWYLRSDIIWHKPNPMPESVQDRPTKAHEYLFLLSKSERYYYDADAIKEEVTGNAHARGDGVNPKARWKTPDGWDTSSGNGGHGSFHKEGREEGFTGYLPKNYKGSLPGRKDGPGQERRSMNDRRESSRAKQNESFSAAVTELVDSRNKRSVWTVATQAFPEAHFATFPEELIKPCILAGCPAGGTVLDPFFGSGTTGLVARANGCKCIGIELNPEYIKIAERRLAQNHLEFTCL